MMRKLLCLTGLILFSHVLFAQNNSARKTDSLNTTASSVPPILKKADGSAMLSTNDIATNINIDAECSSFNRLVQITGISETLKSKGPITVFVPNNQAFTNLPAGKLDTLLMDSRKYDLLAMVTYHVLPGIVTSGDIAHAINAGKGTASFITLTGSKLTARLDANHNIVLVDENGGQSIVNKFNIKQDNGLIHLVGGVLIPRFKNI